MFSFPGTTFVTLLYTLYALQLINWLKNFYTKKCAGGNEIEKKKKTRCIKVFTENT